MFFSCQEKERKEISSDSIFQLQSSWENQNGENLKLVNLQGKTLVVVMIYTSCRTACPILVKDMKQISSLIKKDKLDKVSLVLVSIDPETDTPKRLKEFSITNGMTENYWVFLRSDEKATQEFANVLSMKYKQISPVEFSHSNIISVFSPSGQLLSQEEGLGINAKKVADIVNKTTD